MSDQIRFDSGAIAASMGTIDANRQRWEDRREAIRSAINHLAPEIQGEFATSMNENMVRLDNLSTELAAGVEAVRAAVNAGDEAMTGVDRAQAAQFGM